MRRYWQPVALSEELPAGGAPLSVEILGEELVMFRDDQGRIGLLGLHCAHRGTDLSYGRIEDGGLRCLYHGWLYDIRGRCLEQPGEPGGGEHRDQIRQRAYPCLEKGGVIFTYMGPGEPPLLPNYDFLDAAPDHLYVAKIFHECNYLQANEGNIDPVHLSFLHRFLENQRRADIAACAAPANLTTIWWRETGAADRCRAGRFRTAHLYGAAARKRQDLFARVVFHHAELECVPGADRRRGLLDQLACADRRHPSLEIYVRLQRRRAAEKRIGQLRALGARVPITGSMRNEANRFLQDRESMKIQNLRGDGHRLSSARCFRHREPGRGPGSHRRASRIFGQSYRRGAENDGESDQGRARGQGTAARRRATAARTASHIFW